MKRKIENVLNEIRPFLFSHGGDVKFIEYKDHVVTVEMVGACVGCSLSAVTLKGGIEQILMDEFPEVKEVKALENESKG
jgi:Fe-S cluster biogenesis protein NfuA